MNIDDLLNSLGENDGALTDAHGNVVAHVQEGINGGFEVIQNGVVVQHLVPNQFGGYDHYDHSHTVIGHSKENIFGGHDFFAADGAIEGHSSINIFGGHTHTDANHHVVGETRPSIFGGTDMTENGKTVATLRNDFIRKFWS